MHGTDLDQAAELTVWPRTTPARTARSREYPTLREALIAAGHALAVGNVQTWIITEAGDILSPSWIEARIRAIPALPKHNQTVVYPTNDARSALPAQGRSRFGGD